MTNIAYPLALNPRIGFPRTTTSQEGQLRDLSGVCSALWATRNWEGELYDDMETFHAPSECYPLALRGIQRGRIAIVAEWGWLPGELYQELKRRISPRALHVYAFEYLLGLASL